MSKIPIGPPTAPVALTLLPTIGDVLADQPQELFDAARLHQALWLLDSFSKWVKRRIERLELEEGKDFLIHDNRDNPKARLGSVSYRVTARSALRMVGAQRMHRDENHAAHREILRQHCVTFFELYLAQPPDYQLALNYVVATGLTEAERAGLMSWTVDKWRTAMADLCAAGLLVQDEHAGFIVA